MSKSLKEKLSLWGQQQIEQGISGEINVLVRYKQPLSREQEDKLEEVGYRNYSTAGNFSSGAVGNVNQLQKVAELPFVSEIELSFPLKKQTGFD
ncbi:hypothetical protein F7734_25280 [Scytonema sp. UIC 10036]|uniref:hypothetical protein n=1 Tax=Scytonema sp. UIC 10036 TaxID=2304196 RepID=UPI0012DAD1A6|nr:hypothetical protein [Scytonema sp. UIC 10036]MUG95494.1 hypothetical protein [Scytonema sp. UIC 10036]